MRTDWGQDALAFVNLQTARAKPIQDLDALPLRFIRKTVAEGRELNAQELGTLFAEEVAIFRENPIQYLVKSAEADKKVFDTLKKLRKSGDLDRFEENLGYKIPSSRFEIIKAAAGVSDEDLAAITGSVVGGSVGSSVGGLPGAVIGDFTGAGSARKAAIDIQSVNAVRERLANDDLFKTMTKLEKLQYARMWLAIEVYERSAVQGRGVSGDIGGAIAGNTMSALASSLGVGTPGAIVFGGIAGYRGAKGGNIAYDKIKGGKSATETIPEELIEFLFPQRPGVIRNTKKNYRRIGKLARLIKQLEINVNEIDS